MVRIIANNEHNIRVIAYAASFASPNVLNSTSFFKLVSSSKDEDMKYRIRGKKKPTACDGTKENSGTQDHMTMPGTTLDVLLAAVSHV